MTRPRLRVALAIDTIGPGGAENMVVQLAVALRELGHETFVVTLQDGWMTERARAAGIPVWIEPQRPGIDLRWIVRFAARLRRERIDVLHSHEFTMNVFGGAAALLSGVRTVATIHGRHWIADRKRRVLAYRVLRRLGVPIVAVSGDLAGYLSEGFGLPLDRLRVIHNGIPIPRIDGIGREQARSACGLEVKGLLVLAVGNLYAVKDHATLLRATALLPGVTVAIAGRGEEEAHLRALARELAIESRVQLLGLRDDVDRLLAAADVFVQPSRSEGLPLAILEAMAHGLPVVATRVGGMAEAIVEGETGRLVDPGQPAVLAQALRDLLDDRERRVRMGAAGRLRVVSDFSVDGMARRYASLYETL